MNSVPSIGDLLKVVDKATSENKQDAEGEEGKDWSTPIKLVITCPPDLLEPVSCENIDDLSITGEPTVKDADTGIVIEEGDCGVTIKYADVWIIPPPLPPNPSCVCDGGMVTLTVEYNGTVPATVKVFYDVGFELNTYSVTPGQELTVDVKDLEDDAITKLKANTIFSVNGGPEVKIHTSCSKYILGMKVGVFTVKGWTDGSGSTCNEAVPQILSCDCDGGMIELSVKYTGTSVVDVTAELDASNSFDFLGVQPGAIITFSAWDVNQTKLKKDTKFFVNGGSEAKFHTSCSQDLTNLTIGDFTVVGWRDGDGQICSDSPPEDSGPLTATIIRTWTATDLADASNSVTCDQKIMINLEVDEDDPQFNTDCPLQEEIISCDVYNSPEYSPAVWPTADDCSPVTIAFTDVVILPALPDNPSCVCDGGMVTLTVEYLGTDPVTVDVLYDEGVYLAESEPMNTGDWLTVDATSIGQTKFKADTRFYIDDVPESETKIHTSCSKYILGMVVGDFKVIGWTDGSGSTCNEAVPQILSCDCDGGMIELSVRYNGDDPASVTAQLDASNSLGPFVVVKGAIITVSSWDVNQTKLKRDTKFFVNGGSEAKFHTSCSQDLTNLTIGDFTVVGWLDANGQVCGYRPESEGGPCYDTEITRTWTATDVSGNSNSCTQVITVVPSESPARIAFGSQSGERVNENEIVSNKLVIYPNPASDHLTMVLTSFEEKTIILFDPLGKIIYNQIISKGERLYQLNTVDFPGGEYIVQLESKENGVIREKIMIYH